MIHLTFFEREGKPSPRRADEAFTRIELAAVLVGLFLLASVMLPAAPRSNEDGERAICLNNMKRIMAAVAMYSTDNNDRLPHPSWGADLTGPDNWCYATRLSSGQAAPSANGKGGPDANTNQIPFYLAGQLAGFLGGQRILICPTDWRDSMGSKLSGYTPRPQKLSSYAMNAAVGNYVGRNGLIPYGSTFKVNDFLPADILMWEIDEYNPFNFNDACEFPQVGRPTQRHTPVAGEGTTVVGRSGGSADFVTWGTFRNLQAPVRLNDLLCGPGFK
jgi:hypothetical protein